MSSSGAFKLGLILHALVEGGVGLALMAQPQNVFPTIMKVCDKMVLCLTPHGR